jgi:hypothetical protein
MGLFKIGDTVRIADYWAVMSSIVNMASLNAYRARVATLSGELSEIVIVAANCSTVYLVKVKSPSSGGPLTTWMDEGWLVPTITLNSSTNAQGPVGPVSSTKQINQASPVIVNKTSVQNFFIGDIVQIKSYATLCYFVNTSLSGNNVNSVMQYASRFAIIRHIVPATYELDVELLDTWGMPDGTIVVCDADWVVPVNTNGTTAKAAVPANIPATNVANGVTKLRGMQTSSTFGKAPSKKAVHITVASPFTKHKTDVFIEDPKKPQSYSKATDDCSCTSWELFSVGHKCGRIAPIDRVHRR